MITSSNSWFFSISSRDCDRDEIFFCSLVNSESDWRFQFFYKTVIVEESFSSCFFHVSEKSRLLLSVFFDSETIKKKKIINRSLNIERTRSMTAVSQIRSDFSMSSRYEDFFQKSKKSSKAQEISKLNLIISELKKFKTRSSIKSSSFTRLYKRKERVAQNHSAENENREIAEMTKTNFNIQKYTKTKYNRDAIILLFIFNDKDLNLKIFQEIIDVDMRATKFLYDMMFNTKKTNYRKKAKSFLNSFNDCFLEKFVS